MPKNCRTVRVVSKTKLSDLNAVTLDEAKRWLNLETCDTVDDSFIENELLPAVTAFYERRFDRIIGPYTIVIEVRWNFAGHFYFEFPTAHPYDVASGDLLLETGDCASDGSIEYTEVPEADYQIFATADNPFVRINPTCLCVPTCPPRYYRLTYITVHDIIHGPERLWIKSVLASLFRHRESDSELTLQQTPVFKRLEALIARYEYAGLV